LDQPTRDGDRTIHILTNLPATAADALKVAALYRHRWTLETAYQEPEAALHGEIDTLGYPKAALFAFGIALVSDNVLSAVKAALRSVHGAKAADREISGYDLAQEVAGTYRGTMIAVPKDEWVVFPWDVAAGPLPLLEAPGRRRPLVGIPEAAPRPQEAPPPVATRSQEQTCGDGQTAPGTEDRRTKRSKILHNITPTQGWFQGPTVADVASNLLADMARRSLRPS
jgi:hypothetical protein